MSGAFVFTVTSEPLSTLSPAFGENESTVASSLELLPSASLSVSPAFCSACLASLSVMPFRLGTCTFSLPVETQIVTTLPCMTDAPWSGSSLITEPLGTVSEASVSTVVVRCMSVSFLTASFCERPTMPSGMRVMPDETHRLIVEPLGCDVPEAGSVRVTQSFVTVALSSVCTAGFTSNPASSSASRAMSCE